MAHVAYARGLLMLSDACAERAIGLRVDLGCGDALVSRTRGSTLEVHGLGGHPSHVHRRRERLHA